MTDTKQQLHFRADQKLIDAIDSAREKKEKETGIEIKRSDMIRILVRGGLKKCA